MNKKSNILVAPSILSADFANLERDIKKIEQAGADWVHVDVMDGKFVPNLTIGAPVVKSLRKVSKLVYDVHLMIHHPEDFIKDFINAGSDIITLHYESDCKNLKDTLKQIKIAGKKAGLSIKPKTPASVLEEYLDLIDLILIMTVEPGFGGQKFMTSCAPKITESLKLIKKYNKNIDIEIDGGINADTAQIAVDAGANVLVAGSYVYNATNIKEAIDSLKI